MRAEGKEKACFLLTKAVAHLSEVGILTKTNPRGGLQTERQAVSQARQTAGPSPGEQALLWLHPFPQITEKACIPQTGIYIREEESNLCGDNKVS